MAGRTWRALFLAILFILPHCLLRAEEAEEGGRYRLQDVVFHSLDKTKVSALKRAIRVDTERVFHSKEELEGYLAGIRQRLENTRLLEEIRYEYEVTEEDGDGVQLVLAEYTFSDSNSLLIFPSPSVDSNTGTSLALVLRDQNFMGLMRPLMFSLVGQLGTEEDPDDTSTVTGGFNFFYDYPFAIGNTRDSWFNMFTFRWTFGDDSPSFDLRSGINIGVPIGKTSLNFNFTQAVVHDFHYEKYGDELYFIESGSVSLPLTVATIGSMTPLIYSPFVRASFTWDSDGISEANRKLNGTPRLTAGQSLYVNRINWQGNFRNGYALSTTQSIARNFHAKDTAKMFIPFFSVDGRFYKSWKYAGIYGSLSLFVTHNDSMNIGYRLRGLLDKQTYSKYSIDDDNFALETAAAFTANIDMPVHIVTTDWLGWFNLRDSSSAFAKLLGYLDFELQLSPFFDMALIKNRANGKTFSVGEGLYAAGLEVLVYPQRWKSYVVRASLGFDLSRNTDWRSPRKDYELFIGIGHHF